MKRIVLLFVIISPLHIFGQATFTSSHKLCRANMENAQKSSYLRTIGSVKHCRRPKIANPVSEWSCRESPSESCAKKLIECSREYNCRYLTVDINKKYIEDQIKAGETGSFFPEKVYRETSSD